MGIKINMEVEKSQLLFDCLDFLEHNKDNIVQDLGSFAIPYLESKKIFRGPFLVEFRKDFKHKIVSSLRDVIIDHFNVDAEQAMLVLEMAELSGALNDYLEERTYEKH